MASKSDYYVCGRCGSLGECEHDEDGDQRTSTPMADTCEMVANRRVSGGEEVFNLYEGGLTNAELLCRYGFGVAGNEYNVVRWTAEEVLEGRDGEGWRALLERCGAWDESELVYDGGKELNVNADGQVSHGLWLLLLTMAWEESRMGPLDERQAREVQDDPDPSLIRHIADAVVRMCDRKMRSVHLPTLSDAEVGDRLDVGRRLFLFPLN